MKKAEPPRHGKTTGQNDGTSSPIEKLLYGLLSEGHTVSIPTFGTFGTTKTDEHVTITPDGARTLMPPAITVRFEASNTLKKQLKKDQTES